MVLPSDVVMHVTDNIKANGGKVRLGWLGVPFPVS